MENVNCIQTEGNNIPKTVRIMLILSAHNTVEVGLLNYNWIIKDHIVKAVATFMPRSVKLPIEAPGFY